MIVVRGNKRKDKMQNMDIQLQDKLILWILGLLFILAYGPYVEIVVAGMVSLTIACSVTAFSINRYVYETMLIIYLVLSLFFPEFEAFAPMLLYDILYFKMFPALGVYLCLLVKIVYGLLHFISKNNSVSFVVSAVFFILFSFLAYVLGKRTSKYLDMEVKLKKVRDDAIEQNIYMQDRNDELTARQDYEIHLATLEERNRIAREIHDNVGHMITRAILMAAAINTMEKDENIKKNVEGLSATLNDAMDSIRKSVHDLHDDSINLEKAVRDIVSEFRGFDIRFDYIMGADIPKEVKLCFIAVTKEALNNTAKHSGGDSVSIIMCEQPGFYQLIISDNGVNIPAELDGGIGIINMKERVRKLGGSFNINMSNGFRINVSIMKA